MHGGAAAARGDGERRERGNRSTLPEGGGETLGENNGQSACLSDAWYVTRA